MNKCSNVVSCLKKPFNLLGMALLISAIFMFISMICTYRTNIVTQASCDFDRYQSEFNSFTNSLANFKAKENKSEAEEITIKTLEQDAKTRKSNLCLLKSRSILSQRAITAEPAKFQLFVSAFLLGCAVLCFRQSKE